MSALDPVVSFVLPAATSDRDLVGLLDSLAQQSDPRWELVLYGPAGSEGLADRVPARVVDRVRVLGDLDASLAGLVRTVATSSGAMVCLLNASRIGTETVATVANVLDDGPDVDVIYGDEAVMDEAGELVEVIGRPAWSPLRLRGHNYLAHATLMRRQLLVDALNAMTPGLATVSKHNIVLRVTEMARGVQHLPEVLTARTARDVIVDVDDWEASVAAVQGQLDGLLATATAERGPVPGTVRVLSQAAAPPTTSVVIATDGASGLVRGERRVFVVEAVRSLVSSLREVDAEVVVVHRPECPERVLAALRQVAGERLTLVPAGGAPATPQMLNRGLVASNGEIVVLLSDAVEVISAGFLEQLIGPLGDAEVGMTGPFVRGTDRTPLGTGLAVFSGRVSPMYRSGAFETSAVEAMAVTREVSALGDVCVAIDRTLVEQVGALNESLPDLWSVDLSLKVADRGMSRVWVESAQLYDVTPRRTSVWPDAGERRRLFSRWSTPDLDNFEPGYGRRLTQRREADRRRWRQPA